MAEKRTRVKAPYTPQELNKARADIFGSQIGRLLTRINISLTQHVLKASGVGNVETYSGLRRKLTAPASPGFSLLADAGDWLVIGGEWPLVRNTSKYDRSHYATGSVNAGTPTTFTDATFAGFTANDVGRWIFIYHGANIGLYRISAFIGATQVTLPNASFSTETNVLWAFVDPKDNWGTYEVEQGLSATECLIVDTSEFPIGTGGADSGLLWALVTPPKITLSAGFKFFHNSVIVEETSDIEVPFPAGILNPSTPIAFLYAETQDNRSDSPINYRISYGQVPARNTVILATSVRDHTGQFTEWLQAVELSTERNRALFEAFASSDPERGYLSNAPIIEFDYVQWPPRLTVKPRGVQNGGYHPPAQVLTGAGVSEDGYEDPTVNILDVPVFPPIAGERIDKIVFRQRRVNDREIDEAEGVATTDMLLSEGIIEYRTGISNPILGSTVSQDGVSVKENSSDLTDIDPATDSDHCLVLANEYGTVIFAYTDDKVSSPNDGLKIRTYHKDGTLSPLPITIPPQDLSISGIRGAVDANGWFWICWLENIAGSRELWGCVIDPYGGAQIVSAAKVSGADALLSTGYHGVCMSLMQQATFFWIEAGANSSRWMHTSHDGAGGFDNLGTESDITGNAADGLSVQYQWDTGRVFVAEIPSGGASLDIYIMANDYSAIANYSIDTDTPVGDFDPSSVSSMFVVRNHKDDVFLVCSGDTLSSSDGKHIFAARINSLSSKIHPVTTKRATGAYSINNVSVSKDGRLIICGMYNAVSPFVVCATEKLQAIVETTGVFSPTAPNVPVSFSAAYIPRYGDIACVSQYDDTANKNLAFGFANIGADHNLPLGHVGFDPETYAPGGDFELADISIPVGSLPSRPGLGMHLSPDATPAASTLAINDATAAKLTDSDRSTSILAAQNTSIGMMNTGDVEAIGIIDDIFSDGFDPATDPLSVFEVWYSTDNITWVERTIQDVYRTNGMTYLVFDLVTAKYIKVRFAADFYVPREWRTPTNIVQANIVQMRCFQERASVNVGSLQDSDWMYMRGAKIRHKNIPNYREIYVGDGVSSFGKYLGAEGIQKAIQEASKLSLDSHRARSFPRRKVTVRVGDGAYFMSKPIHFIAGVDVEFSKGAVVYDVMREQVDYSIYSSGYSATHQIWNSTRTLYSTKCLHNYGVGVGSTVFVSDGSNEQLLKVLRLSPDGFQVHLDSPFSVPSGSYTAYLYGKGMRIRGLNMVIQRVDTKISGDLAFFRYIDGLRFEDASISNNTPSNAASYSTFTAKQCRNLYIDGFFESIDATNTLLIDGCIGLGGGHVKSVNQGGVAVYVKDCEDIRGFLSLNGKGDGSAGNDIKLENVTDSDSVLGRIKTDNALAGLGLYAVGTDVDPDEFINLHVHRKGTISILNNGIYESLIAVSLSQIQSLHGTPSVLTPAGVIDGLVSNAIIDSLISV